MYWLAFTVVTALAAGITSGAVSSYLTPADRARLKSALSLAPVTQDLQQAHYTLLAYRLLGETAPKATEICKLAQQQTLTELETIFHASSVSKIIGNCALASPAATLQPILVEAATSIDSTTQKIFYGVEALRYLGLPVDSVKVQKALAAAIKQDDGALSLGYAFHVASILTGDKTVFIDRIEDALVQADEVSGVMLQYEGGISVTSIVLSGIYRLGEQSKKPLTLDEEKATKFVQYLLSRKSAQSPRAVYHLLDVLRVVAENKLHVPVAVTLASPAWISQQEPKVRVRVTNLLGASLGPVTLQLDSLSLSGDPTKIISSKPFTVDSADSSLFELDVFNLHSKPGFYELSVTATPTKADKRWIGNKAVKLLVKITTEVSITDAQIGVADIDQTTPPVLTRVEHPSKLASTLEADFHQKLQLRFTLKQKPTGDFFVAHQAFIRLVHEASNNEIVFVAEQTGSHYQFDAELQAKSKDFNHQSGRYLLQLIVGDSLISNPIQWNIANLELNFPEVGQAATPSVDDFKPKPEIRHVFREPEKRPTTVVSNTFTALSLAPLLLLFILWIKLGVNVSNLSFSPSTIGFHLGLAGIFGLYVVFWLYLNMFETLRYLAGLGLITFLCSNRMLSNQAKSKK